MPAIASVDYNHIFVRTYPRPLGRIYYARVLLIEGARHEAS